jgi:hypothetical protein
MLYFESITETCLKYSTYLRLNFEVLKTGENDEKGKLAEGNFRLTL